eukprot:scaffold1594_cov401-Prasinococcus_capsulatus_cf.AAC.23
MLRSGPGPEGAWPFRGSGVFRQRRDPLDSSEARYDRPHAPSPCYMSRSRRCCEDFVARPRAGIYVCCAGGQGRKRLPCSELWPPEAGALEELGRPAVCTRRFL